MSLPPCYCVEIANGEAILTGPDGKEIAREKFTVNPGDMIRHELTSAGVRAFVHRSDGKGGVEVVEIFPDGGNDGY